MPASKRATKNPLILQAVETLYRAYVSPVEIQDRVAREYSVTTRTVRRYLEEVVTKYAEQEKGDRERNRHQMRATMRAAMAKCLAAGNHKAANAWADKLCKLDGLYEAEKVEHSGQVNGVHVNAETGPLKPAERAHLEKVLLGMKAA